MIKAIETVYKGYRFRSRLEARWAVFFDVLGVRWEYEIEGYELPICGKYLPDFFIPSINSWIEIKGRAGNSSEINKCYELCYETEQPVYLFSGTPEQDSYFVCTSFWPCVYETGVIFEDKEFEELTVIADDEIFIHEIFNSAIDSNYIKATNAFRSARFEHGEVPTW